MPNANNMMFVRPRNCRYCGHGYNGLYHVVQYARSKGLNITDLSEEQANKIPVYDALDQADPASFYGFGHGLSDRYTGDDEEDIFTVDECGKLSQRVCYLLSCLTGLELGPAIIQNGALAYAGFTVSWTWVSGSGTDGDPYQDLYAYGFWESANELWMALIDGADFQTAVQRSIDKYNWWIDYWFYENPGDPSSQDCIMWLAYDRDGLISLDACDLISNQSECEMNNCFWSGTSCHAVPEVPSGGVSLAWIPILAIVGVALIISQMGKKK